MALKTINENKFIILSGLERNQREINFRMTTNKEQRHLPAPSRRPRRKWRERVKHFRLENIFSCQYQFFGTYS